MQPHDQRWLSGAFEAARITVHRSSQAGRDRLRVFHAARVYDDDVGPALASEPIAHTRAALRRDGHSDGSLHASVARGELSRPLRGAYVDPTRATAPPAFYRYDAADALVAAAHAALALMPAGAAVSDETAAFLLCGLWPPDERPRVVVPSPATCTTRRRGTIVRETLVPDSDVVLVNGVRVTNGTRTSVDLARRSRRTAALVAVDALLHADTTSPQDLSAALDRWAGHRGVLQARTVIGLADGRAESPGETRMRLALLDAGLGPLELQVPLCSGRYRVDIVVRGRVLVEFEGSHHDEPDIQLADRQRFNALAALPGATVLRYSSRDLHRLDRVVAEVRAALLR